MKTPSRVGRRISTPRPRLAGALAAAALCLLLAPHTQAQIVPCSAGDAAAIDDAMARIEASVDPCGETPQIAALFRSLRQCSRAAYRVCTRTDATRNLFDRPASEDGPRTITWNPALRSELESSCEGRDGTPVLRDPTASLLHELVHAVHDCSGLDPGENEMEAVRIENIYRRAAGLCQRTRYGDEPLPASYVRSCAPGHCSCIAASDSQQALHRPDDDSDGTPPARLRLGDSGSEQGTVAR